MRKAFENCHWWAKGMGTGCDCKINLIKLNPYKHDCLDGRTYNTEMEHLRITHKEELSKMIQSYQIKWRFAKVFGYMEEYKRAELHHEQRMRGVKCSD